MLFNSYEYILLFLPIVITVYFGLNRAGRETAAKVWLAAASFFFYGWWKIAYVPLLFGSILVNYALGRWMNRIDTVYRNRRKLILLLGLLFDIGLLGYFKYADFMIANINALLRTDIPLLRLVLPLAISFFTFQQIAYLVDTYRGEAKEYSLLNYALFVSFFPQLIAGPIVHHKEMMGQFVQPDKKRLNYANLAPGLVIFLIGLGKKMIIADTFAVWANAGYADPSVLTLLEGWITSLSYTMQLYFDFSGYTDMALGAALMLNIQLPLNFNSPYKSVSIQDFWRRWHMTLGRFLRNYVYIPLGGSRKGEWRTYLNLFLTFLIGGFWHGAGWTFVFWGMLHGVAMVINRLGQKIWSQTEGFAKTAFSWFLTFNFVNLAWVFFRAESMADAILVLKAMFGFNGVVLPESTAAYLPFLSVYNIKFGGFMMEEYMYSACIMIIAALVLVLALPNSVQIKDRFRPNMLTAAIIAGLAVAAILSLSRISEFLYFNF